MKWELVLIWTSGEKEIYTYDTKEEAYKGGWNFKQAFGNQIEWTGVREARR